MASPKSRRRILGWIRKGLLVFVIGIAGYCLILLTAVILSDADIPRWGDPFEDRRGLLRVVPERVLHDIAQHIHFRGTMVVEVVENGQHDLWLIGTSRFSTNSRPLTRTKANETHPIWSPDGKWIAYLSDATGPDGSQGKPELFAYHLSDGKVVQITDAPEIEWHMPNDWLINDGRAELDRAEPWKTWIELTGSRVGASAGETSGTGFYRIPVSGADRNPVLVPNTEGAVGLVRYIYGPGYLYGTSDGTLMYGIRLADDNHDFEQFMAQGSHVVSSEANARGLDLVPGSFAWTVENDGLFYLTQGAPPDGEVGFEIEYAQLSIRRSYDNEANQVHYFYESIESKPVLSGRLGTIRSIIPIWHRKFLALQDGKLDGSEMSGCLRLHFYNLFETPVDQGRPPFFPDVCLDDLPDGLHPQSELLEQNIKHQYGASWRVLSGREPGQKKSSLYAVMVFDNQAYLDLTQIRPILTRVHGEIVPGSVRIKKIAWPFKVYPDSVSHLIDPQPAP